MKHTKIKCWLLVILFLAFSTLTLVAFEKRQFKLKNNVVFELKSYKFKYDLKEPIIILFKVIVKQSPYEGRYAFCLYPKNYVFSIKLVDLKGHIVTSRGKQGFINDGMFIEEKLPMLANSLDDFITVGIVPSYQPYVGYISINDFWADIANLPPGKYFASIKFSPFITKYRNRSNKTEEVQNAWTGELLSNEVILNLVAH